MRIATPYQPFFTNWDRKAGQKPSNDALRHAQVLAMPGSKSALAIAMALRPQGATQYEIALVTGHPHRNVVQRVVKQKKANAEFSWRNGRKVIRLHVAS